MKIILFAWLIMAAVPVLGLPVKGSDLFTGEAIEVSPGSQGTVVVFLSAKCPCSISHVEEIKAMAKEFTSVNFVAIHSNSNEGKDLSRGYFKAAALGFPVIQDTSGELANSFKASKTPHAFLLSHDGKTVYRGGVTDSKDCSHSGRNYLREALNDHGQGKKVRTPEARTLGCAIARGEKSDW